MKTSRIKKIVGVLVSATMLLAMTMGVFAAGSPSANLTSGTRATGPNGEVVNVTFAAASVTPSTADIAAVIPNGTLASAFDLTAPDWDFSKGALTISFPLAGATSSTKAAVLHHNGNAWENVTGTVGDGVVTGTFTSLSPVAIVVDNSTLNNTTGTKASTSPKTGESSLVLTLGLLAMVAAAGAYGLNRKKAFNK